MKFVAALLLTLTASLVLAQGMMGGGGKSDPKLLPKLEKEYIAAKAALAKKPKDPKAKQRFITAGTKYGHESMVSEDLPAKVKYRQALKIYREVLKLDPTNPVAKPESDLIISIYKSMNRPVPQ